MRAVTEVLKQARSKVGCAAPQCVQLADNAGSVTYKVSKLGGCPSITASSTSARAQMRLEVSKGRETFINDIVDIFVAVIIAVAIWGRRRVEIAVAIDVAINIRGGGSARVVTTFVVVISHKGGESVVIAIAVAIRGRLLWTTVASAYVNIIIWGRALQWCII